MPLEWDIFAVDFRWNSPLLSTRKLSGLPILAMLEAKFDAGRLYAPLPNLHTHFLISSSRRDGFLPSVLAF